MTDEEIYLKYRDELIRYAAVLVGPSDAEDVLSAVVTRLYRSKRSLMDLAAPRPYLMRSVLNEALNRRKMWRDRPLVEAAVEPVNSRPEVMVAISALPIKQRAAVYLTFWCGMPSDEVGDLLGCRAATVRRYVHIAKKKLAEVLEDDR